jgi:histone deacetylase 11
MQEFAMKYAVYVCSFLVIHSCQGMESTPQGTLPIVYHKDYNLSFWGIENLHPFDSKKYGRVREHLRTECNVTDVHTPDLVTDEDLRLVHSEEYLHSLNDSKTIARIIQMGFLKFFPNRTLQKKVLDPMRYATQGTVKAAQLALKHGYAFNLGGGYHHASREDGGGFCIFADIPLAIAKLRQENPDLKVLVVDCDAHQGNGVERSLREDENAYILDMYNETIYPHDDEAKKYIHFPVGFSELKDEITDELYVTRLKEKLPAALEYLTKNGKKPNIILYNAGTDIFVGDPKGQMSVSENGIVQRDAFVHTQARDRGIPIAMVLSGGYTKQSAGIIGKSIEHILKTVYPVQR